jgi:Tol biopolymer transport system component
VDAASSISVEGLELFFESDRSSGSGGWDLWVTTRETTDDDWDTPVNLGPTVNSPYREQTPSILADGLSLLFSSNRPGGSGISSDLWVATRATKDDSFGPPVNLEPMINSLAGEVCPNISTDGSTLYFAAFLRPGGPGSWDIWQASVVPAAKFTFGTGANLGPTVNSSASDTAPCISADGLELFFSSYRSGGYGGFDMYVATRATTEDAWGMPVNLGSAVNSSYADGCQSISADGLSLYFSSDRPGGSGNFDLWVTTRATVSDSWSTPINLGPTVNSLADEMAPSISADSLSLYFSGYRSAFVRPGGFGSADLWVTTRATVSDPWGAPVNLGPTVNSSSQDKGPSISADGLSLLFGSSRPGGSSLSGDLWVSTRETKDDSFGLPVNLGPMVNSLAWDEFPYISADGSTLYFNSSRPGGQGELDLWQVQALLLPGEVEPEKAEELRAKLTKQKKESEKVPEKTETNIE